MEINISGISFGLFSIGIGLAIMGFCIGKGLQNFKAPKKEVDYFTFLKESDLEFLLNLNATEIKALLNEHPDIPKITLNGKTYYPKKQFVEWMGSIK